MSENINFSDIVRQIENKEIILPSFQRKFVWTSEESQRLLVASVLAKMPIGSILLLSAGSNEYSSKVIGCKNNIDRTSLKDTVEYLIDGQQRITVLTNLFSNVIQEFAADSTGLAHQSLKRRCFLRIPKWCPEYMKTDAPFGKPRDLFGIGRLKWPSDDAKIEPDFLSDEIRDFIDLYSFRKKDKNPYSPEVPLSTELDKFCIKEDGYLIPLYLFVPSILKGRRGQTITRRNRTIEQIGESVADSIINEFNSKGDDRVACIEFIENFINNKEEAVPIIESFNTDWIEHNDNPEEWGKEFKRVVKDEKAVEWASMLKEYLDSCVTDMRMNKIKCSAKNRGRAIDIYENLNKGGVSLSTFDLVMAKVALVDPDNNFNDRMVEYIRKPKKYKSKYAGTKVRNICRNYLEDDKNEYNATTFSKCLNDDDEASKQYLEAFLDVLSLYSYNPEHKAGIYKLDQIKREKILALTPEQIHKNSEKVWDALDRAMFFFNTHCGIRYLSELRFNLMLVVVATIFLDDDLYREEDVHNKLEAWYWTSMFTGVFEKDQNGRCIEELEKLSDSFRKDGKFDWIMRGKDHILAVQNVSDEDFLLMKQGETGRYPNAKVKDTFCQYLLSRTYCYLLDSNKKMSVFSDEAANLEAHHIIPLGSVKNLGESSQKLRKETRSIYNSPLNFVYITKQTNKDISAQSLGDYIRHVCDEAKSTLHIDSYTVDKSKDDKVAYEAVLKKRFEAMKGEIKNEVLDLLS